MPLLTHYIIGKPQCSLIFWQQFLCWSYDLSTAYCYSWSKRDHASHAIDSPSGSMSGISFLTATKTTESIFIANAFPSGALTLDTTTVAKMCQCAGHSEGVRGADKSQADPGLLCTCRCGCSGAISDHSIPIHQSFEPFVASLSISYSGISSNEMPQYLNASHWFRLWVQYQTRLLDKVCSPHQWKHTQEISRSFHRVPASKHQDQGMRQRQDRNPVFWYKMHWYCTDQKQTHENLHHANADQISEMINTDN